MTWDAWPGPARGVTSDDVDVLGRTLREHLPGRDLDVTREESSGAPLVVGRCTVWDDVVRAGHVVARRWQELAPARDLDVVVDATSDAPPPPAPAGPAAAPPPDLPDRADVVVVGAGISGLAIARELCRRGFRPLVLEAGPCLAPATSRWNNGMVHPGHDPQPETHKAGLNVAGNAAWEAWAADLGLTFRRDGGMIVALDDVQAARLEEFHRRAVANGVPGAAIIDGAGARDLEPRISARAVAALWTPSAASIDPVLACQRMASDVWAHGGTVLLSRPVTSIDREDGVVCGVSVGDRHVPATAVVNAAGVQADLLSATAGYRRFSIHPRRGALVLFEAPEVPLRISIGPVPGTYSKGGGMTARPDGLVTGGPTAVEQQARRSAPPTQDEVDHILQVGAGLMPSFDTRRVVHVGAEVRPATYGEDFVVGAAPGCPGLVEVAGIQSPGIAAAPAIATLVADQLLGLGMVPGREETFTPWSGRTERMGRR